MSDAVPSIMAPVATHAVWTILLNMNPLSIKKKINVHLILENNDVARSMLCGIIYSFKYITTFKAILVVTKDFLQHLRYTHVWTLFDVDLTLLLGPNDATSMSSLGN